MQPAAKTDPPYIPLRSTGWPARRSPRWLIAALAALGLVAVALGIAHRPTPGQRATDLRGFLHSLTADVGSCAAGVRESLIVLHAIDSGASRDRATAVSEASYGAANCSPANNELLDDLTNAQVPESLSSYNLQNAITALIDWAAPRASTVAAGVADVLSEHGQAAEAADLARLQRALAELDAQRTLVYAALKPAIRALSPASSPPVLYG